MEGQSTLPAGRWLYALEEVFVGPVCVHVKHMMASLRTPYLLAEKIAGELPCDVHLRCPGWTDQHCLLLRSSDVSTALELSDVDPIALTVSPAESDSRRVVTTKHENITRRD